MKFQWVSEYQTFRLAEATQDHSISEILDAVTVLLTCTSS
jgi:hypothetical protein